MISVASNSSPGTPPSITIRLSESRVYTAIRINARNAFVGGWLSREAFGLTSAAGNLYAIGMRHQDSGADPTQNASLSAAVDWQYAEIPDGDQGAAAVATAFVAGVDALAGSPFTCVIGTPFTASETSAIEGTTAGVEYVDVEIFGATSGWIGPTMPARHETIRGARGCARTDFGTGNTGVAAAVGATASFHLTGRTGAHRAIGVVAWQCSGSGDMRMALGTGPAYSATPTAFSLLHEGVSGEESADGTMLAPFTDAPLVSSAASLWMSWRAAGTRSIRSRAHASSPVGNGELTLNERIISSSVSTDPTVAIYSGGSYTFGSPIGGSPFAFYPGLAYLYEAPDGNGDYYSTSNVEGVIGFHGDVQTGGTNGAPAVLVQIGEHFRLGVPWLATYDATRDFLLANSDGVDDGYGTVYDWTAASSTGIDPTGSIPLLEEHGALGVTTGAGWKTHVGDGVDLDPDVTTMWSPGWWWGRAGGGALTTLTSHYDVPGASSAYLTGWSDGNTGWSDMVDSGELWGLGLRGVRCQYLTSTTGDMPVGTLTTPAPALFDPDATDATDTAATRNHYRFRTHFRRYGCSIRP